MYYFVSVDIAAKKRGDIKDSLERRKRWIEKYGIERGIFLVNERGEKAKVLSTDTKRMTLQLRLDSGKTGSYSPEGWKPNRDQ